VSLEEHRVVFMVVTGVLVLLVASPALSRLLVLPRTEFFTELWILDSNHVAEDYPFNVTRNRNCSVFLGVGNRLGYCAYYLVEVKFRNQSQSAPTSFGPVGNRTPSSLPALFNITAFVEDEGVWEIPLTFSFNYGLNGVLSQVEFYNMVLNDVVFDMGSQRIAWNSTNSEFRGYLFFELWIYNATSSGFQYHERFVNLRLNMTG